MEEERYVLRNARALAEDYLRRSVREGDTVIDATMGNGGDTEMLCRLVGEQGHVYAFDVQRQAVEHTAERLRAAGLSVAMKNGVDKVRQLADVVTTRTNDEGGIAEIIHQYLL